MKVQQNTSAMDSRRVSVLRRGFTKEDIALFIAAVDRELVMISYRRLVALVAGLLGSAVLRADSFAANSFSAYYLSGREVYNSGCSDTGSAEAACISSTPMGIRTTSSAGFGQNGLFQE